jgi:hypothetical protein
MKYVLSLCGSAGGFNQTEQLERLAECEFNQSIFQTITTNTAFISVNRAGFLAHLRIHSTMQ